MSFYLRWYKTGTQPAIADDTLFWFYRTQSFKTDAGKPPVANKYGPVADLIYVTANLRAPATLEVRCRDKPAVIELKAGSQDVSVPFVPGCVPQFALRRGSKVSLQGRGGAEILADPRFNDFYYETGMLSSGAQTAATAGASQPR